METIKCDMCEGEMEYITDTEERWTGFQDKFDLIDYEGWECTNEDCKHFIARDDYETEEVNDDS